MNDCLSQYNNLKTKLVDHEIPEGIKDQILFVIKMVKIEEKSLNVCSGFSKDKIIEQLAANTGILLKSPCSNLLFDIVSFIERISQKRPEGNQMFGIVGSVINLIYSVKFNC